MTSMRALRSTTIGISSAEKVLCTIKSVIHSHHVCLDVKACRIFLPVPKPTLIPKLIILLTSRMPPLKLRERDHNKLAVKEKHRPLITTLRIVKTSIFKH